MRTTTLPMAALPIGTVFTDGAVVTGPAVPMAADEDPFVPAAGIIVPTDGRPHWGHRDQTVRVQAPREQVGIIAARVNRGDTLLDDDGSTPIVYDYDTAAVPGRIVWTLNDGSTRTVVPTSTVTILV